MRRVCLACTLLLAAGCQSEPSFDERYGSAEQAIRDKAAGIDAELGKQGRASGIPATAAPSPK